MPDLDPNPHFEKSSCTGRGGDDTQEAAITPCLTILTLQCWQHGVYTRQFHISCLQTVPLDSVWGDLRQGGTRQRLQPRCGREGDVP